MKLSALSSFQQAMVCQPIAVEIGGDNKLLLTMRYTDLHSSPTIIPSILTVLIAHPSSPHSSNIVSYTSFTFISFLIHRHLIYHPSSSHSSFIVISFLIHLHLIPHSSSSHFSFIFISFIIHRHFISHSSSSH